MANTSVEIEGAEEIVKRLKAMGDKAQDVIGPATREGAELVKAEIERRALEDSGETKAEGFMTRPGSMTDQAANTVVTISDRKFEHVFYNEFGAPNRARGGTLPARPIIRQSFEAKRAEAARVVEAALKRALGL
jgi:hypothetical protein